MLVGEGLEVLVKCHKYNLSLYPFAADLLIDVVYYGPPLCASVRVKANAVYMYDSIPC